MTANNDGTYTFELGHGDSVKFANIPYGAKITVTEGEHNGFLTGYTIGTTSADGDTAVIDSLAGNTTIAFTNTPGAVLPSTGGMGTAAFRFGGLLLMAAGMTGYIRKRKERMPEENN